METVLAVKKGSSRMVNRIAERGVCDATKADRSNHSLSKKIIYLMVCRLVLEFSFLATQNLSDVVRNTFLRCGRNGDIVQSECLLILRRLKMLKKNW